MDTVLPVSVLIVNFNGARHLPACLTALEQQTLPRYRFEVILLDNASRDDSVKLVRSQFPWVKLIASPTNTGFAEGNNIAAQYAHGRLLVLLNNDTIPDPFWLEELLRVVDHRGGAVASKLVFADDPQKINSAGLCLLRDGRGADLGFHMPDDGRFETGGPIFAGCGAALAVPAPRHGEPLLDPRYFVYYEDLDLGWRRRLAGQACWYAPRSLVRHVHGAAAGDKSPLFWFSVERNRALTSLRNADLFLALWSGLVLFAKVAQAFIRLAAGGTNPRARWPVARAVLCAALSYLRWMPIVLLERQAARSHNVPITAKRSASVCTSS